ncbi:MAG TPA: ABC transporter permease [Candidatus Acidoferrales bacterium]|nr:ABC transporter permease [Candidatus Acidoferrales bacterium]
MNWISRLFSRRRLYGDLSAEIEEHLNEKIDELIAGGMSREEAAQAARREFGNVTLLEERGREVWQWPSIESFFADIRFALRMLRKSPGFTAVAILTLALGIGANTAIFSVVYGVLLQPLPICDPGRVVVLHDQLPNLNLPRAGISPLQFRDYSAHTNIFASTALLIEKNLNLTGAGQPQRLLAMRASATLFPLLGIRPILGRTFTAAEDTYGNGHVVLLSEGLWKGIFGGARNAIGKRVQLDGESYEVIGVLPEKLEILYPNIQLWVPMAFTPKAFTEDERWSIVCTMLARLRSGVTLGQARAVMSADAAHIRANVDKEHAGVLSDFRIEVRPLMDELVGNVRQPLYLLLGAVLLVLLIACANIANLLLARGSVRSREMAIRAAIGAGRRRIIAQLLTESVLLSLTGGALGLLLAWWGITALIRFAPASLPHANTIRLDPAVLGFTFAVSMLAGIFFGLAPAMRASKLDLNDALKENGRADGSSGGRQGLRRALILSEVALTFILLVGSGLLLRSFAKLLDVNPGFDPTNVMTMRISPSKQSDAAHAAAFSRALLDRVSAMPVVLHAALADDPPLMQPGNSVFAIRDYRPGPNAPQPHADNVAASPDYFAAMGIPLLRGHVYREAEMLTGGEEIQKGSVVMIDEALAKRFWPGKDAVGKQLGWDNKGPWATIVGVVGTVRSDTLVTKSNGTIYFPLYGMTLVVRTASDPRPLAGALRAQVEMLDSSEAVYGVKTMSERVAESVAQQRFAASLLALFAALALVLAAVGLYSVMVYIVTQRTHEIGVRMALGAQRDDVLHLILGGGAKVVFIGVCIGIAGALTLAQLMRSLLFGISAIDPLTFIAAAVLLVLVALAAGYIPARRAMRVDPLVALRYE